MGPKRITSRLLALGAAAAVALAATSTAPAVPAPEPTAARAITGAASPAAAPHDAGSRPPLIGPAPGTEAARWRALAREEVGVLARPSETADTVPQRIRRQPLLSDGAVDLAAAREVERDDAPRTWIAPSRDGTAICAFREGGMACPSVARLTETGLSPGIFGRVGEPFHIWAIVGDDVSAIVLTEADSTRTSLTAVDNFVTAELDDWPRSIAWTTPDGPESFVFPAFTGGW